MPTVIIFPQENKIWKRRNMQKTEGHLYLYRIDITCYILVETVSNFFLTSCPWKYSGVYTKRQNTEIWEKNGYNGYNKKWFTVKWSVLHVYTCKQIYIKHNIKYVMHW